MATRDINNFNFWCPVEISKAIDEETGEEIMLLGGIASTADEDSDGEFLDPKGFDIKPLLESGMVNWHHQAKTCPGTIVGEPTKAEIRKEGLYIETKLYPSSPVARDIWELAKTLESDSDTRRLGYSIEGRVLERGSNDKTEPGYKKITKAVITGVAITHQPKNPKTFANIIKGDIDDDFENEETEETEETDSKKKTSKEEKKYYEGIGINDKSLDTDSARPLIKEEVDPKVKVVTFGKAEIMEKLFQDITGISIEKANDIYILIKNISKMKKKAMVTEEDIAKAYDALGISPESISKGEDNQDSDTDDEDVEDEEEDEDDDEAVKKAKTKKSADSDEEDEEEDEEEEDDEEEEEDEDEDADDEDENDEDEAQKAQIFGRFDRLEKAMAISHLNESKYIKALGVMVKAQSDDLSKAIDSLNLANDKIDEQNEVIKAQTETISALQERLEEFGSGVPAPKSVRHSNPVERTFGKGQDNDFEKGGDGTNKISIKNRAAVSEVLDQATFQKGFDNEFSNACTAFEANGTLSSNVITRLKTEYGIEIVQ